MKADPFVQLRLLDLQAVDTALGQLAHKRSHLPEHAEITRLSAGLDSITGERASAQAEVDDLDRDIKRYEGDIDQVRQRAARNQARLDSGQGSPKELEATQHELTSLGRRQAELEDTELELMEKREAAQVVVAEVTARRDHIATELQAAAARRDALLAEIAAEEEKKQAARGPIALNVPADLLALYEKIRKSSGGIGAAMLRARRCEGCRLELSGGDLARVRTAAPDEVVRCEECRRILIRTGESGL
ncbi:zinc ribbon domain-containing protein [Longispora albida]|uniref:zinc ribbon domain-containing protein n=1 Tax=Longispora albida TaxID=203523 RepID=UPI00037D1244|nr:C4-type zinc ribbon domain-containing protein [Longispora albida]